MTDVTLHFDVGSPYAYLAAERLEEWIAPPVRWRRARRYGLPSPDPWPSAYLTAMRAATAASTADRGTDFARAAFRSAFREGRDLSSPAQVFDAAHRAGLDQATLELEIREPEIKHRLRAATDAAYEAGVFGVPTIAGGDELFWGDDRLEEAAAWLSSSGEPRA